MALWRDHANIESPQVIAELVDAALGEIVFDMDDWATHVQGAGVQAVEQAYARAGQQGVSFAPTFYLGTEPFQGRAQLPLILARLRAGI